MATQASGKGMLPANDRWEDRDRRQRTQTASYRTRTSVSGEIRLSRQRSTRHLGRTIRRGEYAWRPRQGPSARSHQGQRHAGSNKPRRRRPFSRGQSRLYTKGIRPPNRALRNTRSGQQAEARTRHPRAYRSLRPARPRYYRHRLAPSAQGTQRRPAKPSPSDFAGPTPRLGSRGVNPTEYLYVKLPCPSVSTSY